MLKMFTLMCPILRSINDSKNTNVHLQVLLGLMRQIWIIPYVNGVSSLRFTAIRDRQRDVTSSSDDLHATLPLFVLSKNKEEQNNNRSTEK